MDYKYTGIVLGKVNVGETDRIYSIYTKEVGKVRFLAKGVRKPNAKLAGSLEPLTSSEIFVAKSRGMGKITGAIVSENFSKIKTDIDVLSKINYVLKIFNKSIADQEQDEKIFKILESFFKSLDNLAGKEEAGNKMDVVVLGFLLKLLSEMGYEMEVEKCVHCRKKLKPENNYFNPVKGGVICADCFGLENEGVKINSESIKLIRIILKNKIENLPKLQVAQKDVHNLKIVIQEAINWV